ncbi:MAG: peptide chain release factor-like protein, partial [Endomicrobiia bacterium]
VVQCQDERSQIKNREKAMKLLKAKLYQLKLEEQQAEISTERRKQIGSGKRAEKIRTYNFPQNRVTDHRINFSIYDLKNILDGKLDPLIEKLKEADVQD